MAINNEWLPVGSVVTLEGGQRSIMVAGFMIQDGNTGRYWDYVGYPYPEGRQRADADYFFDRAMISSVQQVGLMTSDGMLYRAFLEDIEGEFGKMRSDEAVDAGEEPATHQ